MSESDLYFMLNPALGIIKIGITGDINARRISIEHACGVPLTVLRLVEGGARYEKELHDAFGADRLCGEWFTPTDALVRLATAGADVADYLKSVRPATQAWRAARDAEIARKKKEAEDAARAERAELARLAAEAKRIKAERAAKTEKARAAIAERRREQHEEDARSKDELRRAWLAKDIDRINPVTDPEAARIAAERRQLFEQRARNALMLGVLPEVIA